MKKAVFFLLGILPVSILFAQKATTTQDTITSYTKIPLGSIRPTGWLLKQLETMRDGSTGHLDELHPKIRDYNGWLGFEGDGWEETPYWLDGAVPLAYLLNDAGLKTKIIRYINWTLKENSKKITKKKSTSKTTPKSKVKSQKKKS